MRSSNGSSYLSEEDLLALLEMIAQKCKANRSPYVPVVYFKHVPKYKRKPDDLRRKGLVFLYKAGKAVGISRGALSSQAETA